MPTTTKTGLKIADEVWIATALLHRENPDRSDFSVQEIVGRAAREAIAGSIRPGVYVHAVQHCVANRPPSPGTYRMLFETGRGRRRLFRRGDAYDRGREGGKVTPIAGQIPSRYARLLDWYQEWSSSARFSVIAEDPLMALEGSGAELWSEEGPDAYVRRLREGWE
ncbi:MAG: hypothetical protein WB780_24150 [Candidatus Acidiferrales bacterium]